MVLARLYHGRCTIYRSLQTLRTLVLIIDGFQNTVFGITLFLIKLFNIYYYVNRCYLFMNSCGRRLPVFFQAFGRINCWESPAAGFFHDNFYDYIKFLFNDFCLTFLTIVTQSSLICNQFYYNKCW